MELGHLVAAVATTLSVAAAFAVLTAVSVCVERRDMRAMACAGAALVSSLAVGGLSPRRRLRARAQCSRCC